jgi:hypothetical protein
LFITPAFVLGPGEPVCEFEVHILGAADLQQVRLVKDIGVVVGSGFALRDVESKANAGMRIAVVTPEQKVVPIPAEAQDSCCVFLIYTTRVSAASLIAGWVVSRGQRSNGSLRSSIVETLSRLFCRLQMAYLADVNL